MASSLQRFEPGGRTADAPVFSRPSTENQEMARWEMRIGLSHVIVLWAVLAGMMVMVFLFGFHAGREQGLSRALSSSVEETVRLPVAMPIPARTEGQAAATTEGAEPSPSASTSSAGGKAEGEAGATDARKVEAETTFDFSKSGAAAGAKKGTVVPESAGKSAAGFSTKPALGLFAEEGQGNAEALAALEKPNSKAAEPAATRTDEVKVPPAGSKEQRSAAGTKLSQISPPLKETTNTTKAKAAEPEKPASAAPRIKVQSVPTGLARGWYIQAAATRTKEDAAALVARFGEKGFAGVVEQAQVKERTYYRVLIGPYADREVAQNSRGAVKSSGITGGEPFLKHVE